MMKVRMTYSVMLSREGGGGVSGMNGGGAQPFDYLNIDDFILSIILYSLLVTRNKHINEIKMVSFFTNKLMIKLPLETIRQNSYWDGSWRIQKEIFT